MKKALLFYILVCLLIQHPLTAQLDTLGWRLEHYTYPYPVKYMNTTVEGQPVELASFADFFASLEYSS